MKKVNQLITLFVGIIIFDIWILWDSKNFAEDYYFLTKDIKTSTGKIISKTTETGERETEENDIAKDYKFDFYTYQYEFYINKKRFLNTNQSLEDYNSNEAIIEYIINNPSINRIKAIAEINTPTKFFKEYFFFKLFFLSIVLWIILSVYKDSMKSIKNNNN